LKDGHSLRRLLRKPHFQRLLYAQVTLVRVIKGLIWHVAVDIRPESPTLKQYVAAYYPKAETHHQLLIPKGLIVTSKTSTVQYKTNKIYEPTVDAGIHPHDPDLSIPWPLPKEEHLLSNKDILLPSLSNL
jgi:dTDP-4-dehydrorhamnose 3,5-epimerase